MERFSRMMGNNPSLKKVADDLRLTSELILLVRMIFADGELKAVELDAFKKLCSSAFGLNEEDIPGVLKYLKDFGYETTAWDAAAMFKSYSPERKREMLLHLLEIAKSDGQVHESEAEMIRRTADILGLTAEEIHTMRAG
ncbi:MAG: TerB family tellurite resistance protein [Nitratireductor sp.]|nr:TerB family tellurite resistance protein [Nitratireductor sp.]